MSNSNIRDVSRRFNSKVLRISAIGDNTHLGFSATSGGGVTCTWVNQDTDNNATMRTIWKRELNKSTSQATLIQILKSSSSIDFYNTAIHNIDATRQIISWTQKPNNSNDEDTYIQLFVNGVASGDIIQLLYSSNIYDQSNPRFAVIDSDKVAVVWNAKSSNSQYVHARVIEVKTDYNPPTLKAKDLFNVISYSGYTNLDPRIASFSNNEDIAISWIIKNSQTSYIYLEKFDDKEKSKGYFSVTNYPGTYDSQHDMTMLPDDKMLVSWTMYSSSRRDVFAKIMDDSGNTITNTFRVNKNIIGDYYNSHHININNNIFGITSVSTHPTNHLQLDSFYRNGTRHYESCRVLGIDYPGSFNYKASYSSDELTIGWQDGFVNKTVYLGYGKLEEICRDPATPTLTSSASGSRSHGTDSETVSKLTNSKSTTSSKSTSDSATNTISDSSTLTDTKTISQTSSESRSGGTLSNSPSHSGTTSDSSTHTVSDSISGTTSGTQTSSDSRSGGTVSNSPSHSGTNTISVTSTDTTTGSLPITQSISVSGNTLSNSKTQTTTISNSGKTISGTSSKTDTISNSETVSGGTISSTSSASSSVSESRSLECHEVFNQIKSINLHYIDSTIEGSPIINTNNTYVLYDSSVFKNEHLSTVTYNYDHKITNDLPITTNNHHDDLQSNQYITDGKVSYDPDCIGIESLGLSRKRNDGKKTNYEFYKTSREEIDCLKGTTINKNGEVQVAPNRGVKVTTAVTFYKDVAVTVNSKVIFSGVDKFDNILSGDALISAGNCLFIPNTPQKLLNNNLEIEASVNRTLYYDLKSSIETIVRDFSDNLAPTDGNLIYKISGIEALVSGDTTIPKYVYSNTSNINKKKYGSVDTINQDQVKVTLCTDVDELTAHVNAKEISNIKSLGVEFQYGEIKTIAPSFIANFKAADLGYDGLRTHGRVCYDKDLGSVHSSTLVPSQCIHKGVRAEIIEQLFKVDVVGYFSAKTEAGLRVCNSELSTLAKNVLTRDVSIFADECMGSFNETLYLTQDILGDVISATEDC